MTHSVSELIEMARALSEGDFDQEFTRDFNGEMAELASYMDGLKKKLKALSPSVSHSYHLMPEAAKGVAEMAQQAENGVNSILELVEKMISDQEKVLETIGGMIKGQGADLNQLQQITERARQSLMSVISYLSFQDVLRQRAEKVQEMIETVQHKILELLVKFKVKVNEQVIREGDGRDILRTELSDLSQGMGLDQSLVDKLLGELG